MATPSTTRPIHQIASDIAKEWRKSKKGINYAAKPYLEALQQLSSKNDKYMYDDAKTVGLYFLSNASSFRGERAKELKAELKKALEIK